MPAQIVRLVMTWYMLPLARGGNLTDTQSQSVLAVFTVGISLLVFAAQFSTVRRRNGFAALQDLASGTRVVLRPRSMASREAAVRATRADVAFEGDRVGPYLVPRGSFDRARTLAAPLLVSGFDDRLRRAVWVELLPEGTPPVPGWRRDLGRATRLRWLSGRRQGADSWDAYEAVDGMTFTQAIAHPQPWERVRHWTVELASEIGAASRDGSLPLLAADRIWIDADDRARLLDWGSPSPGLRIYGRDLKSSALFLYGATMGALRGQDPEAAQQEPPDVPLPLAARAYLQTLRAGTVAGTDAPVSGAADLLRGPAVFPRGRRAAQIAVCAFLPVLMPIAVVSTLGLMVAAQTANPKAFTFDSCVKQLAAFERRGEANLTATQKENRRAIEIYIAEHLREEVQESAAVARSFPILNRVRGEHSLAERAIAKHPVRTPADVQKADAIVARLVANNAKSSQALNTPIVRWAMALFMIAWTCAIIAGLSVIGALVTGSGFTLRSVNAALVNRRGERASRLRALLRGIVGWLPAAALLWLVLRGPQVQAMTIGVALAQSLPLVLFAAAVVWAALHPSRGIQDRVAGTWIVPR